MGCQGKGFPRTKPTLSNTHHHHHRPSISLSPPLPLSPSPYPSLPLSPQHHENPQGTELGFIGLEEFKYLYIPAYDSLEHTQNRRRSLAGERCCWRVRFVRSVHGWRDGWRESGSVLCCAVLCRAFAHHGYTLVFLGGKWARTET